MIWSLRSYFAIVTTAALAFFGFVYSVQAIVVPDLRVGTPQGCEIIELNWKDYGERVRGANTKVSNVVLNACEAIGGRDQCTFLSGCRYNEGDANQSNPECTLNTGVSNSQHRHNNAIDLKVPEEKGKEFITLAICGLRKVNNCQGGVGYYKKIIDDGKSGAIHIDVRTGRTSIWSTGYKRINIPENVQDPEAREILYSFGDGECVTGSIVGDKSEEGQGDGQYGPIEEYTPPEGYSDEFRKIIQTQDSSATYYSYEGTLAQSLLTNPFANSFQTGGTVFDGSKQVFSDDLVYVGGDTSGDVAEKKSGTFTDFISGSTDSETSDDTASGVSSETNEVSCEGSGLFGTNLFNTCNDATENSVEEKEVTTKNNTSVVSTLLNSISRFTGTDNTNTGSYTGSVDTEDAVKGTVYTEGSQNIFYGTHIPDDSVDVERQTPVRNIDTNNYGQFVSTEQEVVTSNSNSSLNTTARIAEKSVLYGTYYGMVHGVSPLLIGSMPRSLLRLTEGNDFTRVHNLFSI